MVYPKAKWVVVSAVLAGGCAAKEGDLHVHAKCVADIQSIVPGKSFRVGVHFVIPEGAHIYWLNPGDIGLPTRVSWQVPEGIHVGPLQWPCPRRFVEGQLVSYGYEREVVLWSEMVPSTRLKIGEIVELKAEVGWLVCRETCVPGGTNLTLYLRVSDEAKLAPSEGWALIERHERRVPKPQPGWQFQFEETAESVVLYVGPPSDVAADGLNDWVFVSASNDLLESQVWRPWQEAGPGWFKVELAKTPRKIPVGDELEGVLLKESRTESPEGLAQGAIRVTARRKETAMGDLN